MHFHRIASALEQARTQSTAWTLVAANFSALVGVGFWGWSTFALVVAYWAENVIIGLINVLKLVCCCPANGRWSLLSHAAKLFFIPFFVVHYGRFCYVHGEFVFHLLGGEAAQGVASWGDWTLRAERIWDSGLFWAIALLAISHLYSFFRNYLMDGEYRRSQLMQLMFQPYARVVVLHIAILLGALATAALGSPIWVLVILICGKTAIDLALHPINGNKPERRVAGNLFGDEAAQLAKDIGAGLVLPHHYDLFEFNTASPELFVHTCESLGQPYRVPKLGERVDITIQA